MKPAKAFLLTLLIVAIYILHQDFWNWKKAEPLVLGFLPVGLAYHAAYSVVAAMLMAALVSVAWPKHLENVQGKESDGKGDQTKDH